MNSDGGGLDSDQTKELAKTQFGREASKYVTSQVHSSLTDLEFVLDFVEPCSDWVCLDIATGTGHLALTLAPHVKHVLASDITPEMLDETETLARQRKIDNLATSVVDVHEIPYSSNSYDFVTSRIAPHHFFDIDKAIEEMVRVGKAGGYIFIQDTVAPSDSDAAKIFNEIEKLRDPSHVKDLSVDEWIELLESKGCRVLKHITKSKDWPLRWWTERMSTPGENVERILDILEEIYEEYREHIHINRDPEYPPEEKDRIDAWSMHPHNGYFLAQIQ